MATVVSEHPGLVGRPVYLDYNATTPVDPRVVEAMLPVLTTGFGNPSSGHVFADGPRAALDGARGLVADLVGARSREMVFTGSGSEADALAVRGAVLAALHDGATHPHVITQVTEHPAVLAACRALESEHGAEITYLPVDSHGIVDPDDVAAAITSRTVLVSVMHANNETGTVQPVADIAAVTRAHGVLLHTDAAQSVGKVPVDVGRLGVDLLTLVGHKMYAPKGIAALYVRDGVRLSPLVGGGGQERGLRAGTENVALAVALGAAAALAGDAIDAGEPRRLAELRDLLSAELRHRLPGRVHVHGHPTQRLPHTLNLRIDGARAQQLLARVPGLAASTGSACHTGRDEPSEGLRALGLSRDQALAAIRLSLGRWTTPEQTSAVAAMLASAAA
ncbi:MAG TPA: cysteine desulfurase family protein [Actinomycetales bacterium]|nr:cysteine desulfurase family protein [Actinomycetales bacterium]